MTGGDRDRPVHTGGAEELTGLGEAVNRLAADLRSRIEEIRGDRGRLEGILAAMDEGIALIASGEDVTYANAAARRVLGGVPDELRHLAPRALQDLVAGAQAAREQVEAHVETGMPVRIIQARALPLGDGDVLLLLRDVTAAQRLAAMRRDFVADASHELKTPATSIQAAAETLEHAVHDDPEAATAFATRLRRDAARLSRIVSDLLDLSRLESDRPQISPVRLDRLAAEEAERIRGHAVEVGLEVELVADPVTVPGSAKDLSLLVGNLLENAVRYTPAGGRVRLEVAAENGRAVLTISDTGIGIPRRDLPRIFERFYRVDRARSRATGGTGLGLSIARHVAERHGGEIEADSELGRGSTFRVTLPSV
jgi:signal transduction histidine kinase